MVKKISLFHYISNSFGVVLFWESNLKFSLQAAANTVLYLDISFF